MFVKKPHCVIFDYSIYFVSLYVVSVFGFPRLNQTIAFLTKEILISKGEKDNVLTVLSYLKFKKENIE
jgi:hypothetical protein